MRNRQSSTGNRQWRPSVEVGADGEVVEPEDYRHAMRLAVA
jgi:hypothetical protein